MDGGILDTHLHLVDRTRLDYPWLSGVPPLDRDWPLADYAREARRIGISGALHMEVDVADDLIEQETTWIEDLAAGGSFPIRGIIAAARPEHESFPEFLDRAADRDLVVGFRRPLHVVPDDISQTDLFTANLNRLAGPDLPFDICVEARQLPLAIALVDAVPNVRFVLDHCGVPDIAGDAWEDWARNITELARRSNVSAKISGVVAYGGPDWTLEEVARWIDHVIGAFGRDRLVWGGDWPVCTLGGGLSTWVAATRTLVADWSDDDRSALFHANAERIWKL